MARFSLQPKIVENRYLGSRYFFALSRMNRVDSFGSPRDSERKHLLPAHNFKPFFSPNLAKLGFLEI